MVTIQYLKKMFGKLLIIYLITCFLFSYAAGDQLSVSPVKSDSMVIATAGVGEITEGTILEQPFKTTASHITKVILMGSTFSRENTGILEVEIISGNESLGKTYANLAEIQENIPFTLDFKSPVVIPSNQNTYLKIRSPYATKENSITLYYGSNVAIARGEIDKYISNSDLLRINGLAVDGMLCFELIGYQKHLFGKIFPYIAILGEFVLVFLGAYEIRRVKKNKPTRIIYVIDAMIKYHFLIDQLVARDFKTKYKRSFLGVLWSFFNPLLTMLVQYIVFSTLFKSDIENFPVYLLTGIICFSFFSECTSMGLTSIVGNASLITKVYIPKYIYPLTRAMSSTINFVLGLIPLFIMIIVTNIHLTKAVLLLPFGIICLFALSLGVSLILASAMVFFKDTQFLWNIFIMLWMYLTPIFYPDSIIPSSLSFVLKCNPLYHVIRFFRSILMQGYSPEPKAYLLCFLITFLPLVVGLFIFKKTQDKFALHI